MRWLAFLPPGWSDTQPWVFEQLCTRPPTSKCAEKPAPRCGEQQCRKKAWLCQATLRTFHVEKGACSTGMSGGCQWGERSPAHFYEAGVQARRRQWLGGIRAQASAQGSGEVSRRTQISSGPCLLGGWGGASMGNSD